MITDWLNTPLGRALLRAEHELLKPVFEGVFGEFGVQVGRWGAADLFVPSMRTQRVGVVSPCGSGGVRGQPERLPLAGDSVDLLLLPHTLDFCDHPHAVLREASRVLRSDGQIVVVGFKPGGLWGLKRLWPGASFPPGTRRLVSTRELSDWLELLDLRVVERQRFFFRAPRLSSGQPVSEAWERRGDRFWPELAACYLLRAQKRLHTLTPVRQRWRQPTKVVATLVKPTARIPRDAGARRVVVPFTPPGGRQR